MLCALRAYKTMLSLSAREPLCLYLSKILKPFSLRCVLSEFWLGSQRSKGNMSVSALIPI